MGDRSAIEWTEATWNPIVGCSVVSPGCTNCYAMKMAARIERMAAGSGKWTHYNGTTQASKSGPVWTGRLTLAPDDILTAPLCWKRPRRIFVNSMSDLFHEAVPDEWIDRIFAVMAMCPQHTFQVLTKRSARMRQYMDKACGRIADTIMAMRRERGDSDMVVVPLPHVRPGAPWWPLPNVWSGVSAEDQRRADERVPDLRETPAAVRFVSAEPLLGSISFEPWLDRINWIIVGGESGPGARPMHPDWARSIRDQCAAAGVPFFFKQWGEWANPGCVRQRGDIMLDGMLMRRVGKRTAGRLLDGREHNAMPEARPL